MSDIVERLRYFGSQMCHEAADEITRLRDQLARAREFHAAELADVTAERDQLRQYLDAAQRRGEELRAQVAALEVDAGRYRWLRDGDWEWMDYAWMLMKKLGGIGAAEVKEAQLDAVVDAALAARKGEHAD